MTLNEYQKLASRTMNPNINHEETRNHALHGIASEVGEIHSIFQKVYQGHTFGVSRLFGEVGDLLWFIAELATVYGVDLDDVATMNIEKLKKRYPEGFDESRSLNRAEGDL